MADTYLARPVTRIEGRVAQFLSAREIVLNIGSDVGVKAGMKFAVVEDRSIEVRDPLTGEILDTIEREKIRVEAVDVRKKIAICETYRIRRITPPILRFQAEWASNFEPSEVPETFPVGEGSIPNQSPAEDRYVKVNDRVIQILNETE